MGSTSVQSPEVTVADTSDVSAAAVAGRADEEGPTVIAGRYHLRGLLGSGGMGTVYRAFDAELDEVVALKVLKRTLAQTPQAVERFRREVKLARKVTHRNVARTFDIGEHAGDRFLTMEYVDGSPLSSVLREGALSVPRACAIALELCDGLAASHDAGVLHVDLKPQNVICERSGRVVVTDFGIARALQDDGGSLDEPGTLAGTPAYMAPEQIEGAPLDGRVDIYALGCMLFRMFSGRMPWTGPTPLARVTARLMQPPPDLRDLDPRFPSGVAEAVLRCMARLPQERFGSTRELADALRPFAEGAPSPSPQASRLGTRKSVAVLTLVNEGPAEDAYLATGLADVLVDAVSAFPRQRVLPRRAAERHAALGEPRAIGQALGVDVVVHGTLDRVGDALSVVLRMIAVRDGFQLWAKRFEATTATLPALVAAASRGIADALAAEAVAPPDRTTDPVALELHMRGRFVFTRSYAGVIEAAPLLRDAYARASDDPRIALTYVQALVRLHSIGASEVAGSADLPGRIAEAAVATTPASAQARIAKGIVHFEEGEYRSAALELGRALALDPDDADALHWTGRMLYEAGRPEAALARLLKARAADPNNAVIDASVARSYAALGDWSAALWAVRTPTFERNDASLHWVLVARLVLWTGDRDLAARELARMESHELDEGSRLRASAILRVLTEGGLSGESLGMVVRHSAPLLPRRDAFRTQIEIELLLAAGETDVARERLPSLDDHFFFDLSWLDSCPLLAPLHATPELAALRRATTARVGRALEVLDAL